MKQLAKGLTGLAVYGAGIIGMVATSKSEYLNTAEKIFTLGVESVLAVFGLWKGVDAMAEENNYMVNGIATLFKKKQKNKISIESLIESDKKSYENKLNAYHEAYCQAA